MSWIDKELRRRQKQEARQDGHSRGNTSINADDSAQGEDAHGITALWERLEAANAALPPELRLPRLTDSTGRFPEEFANCVVVLRAANGAGIGFTGTAIRYVWPKKRLSKSNNLWIKTQGAAGYAASRRVKTSMPGITMQDAPFDDRSVERIVRSIVTNRQVTWRMVTRRRFLFF
ncbi:MAG: hypothetical protein RJA10_3442 [Pseudomonadota bacterium]|jgi:hypothetical protein